MERGKGRGCAWPEEASSKSRHPGNEDPCILRDILLLLLQGVPQVKKKTS